VRNYIAEGRLILRRFEGFLRMFETLRIKTVSLSVGNLPSGRENMLGNRVLNYTGVTIFQPIDTAGPERQISK